MAAIRRLDMNIRMNNYYTDIQILAATESINAFYTRLMFW